MIFPCRHYQLEEAVPLIPYRVAEILELPPLNLVNHFHLLAHTIKNFGDKQ
jgi:hypothetical protein